MKNKLLFKISILFLFIISFITCKDKDKNNPSPVEAVYTLSNSSPVPMQVVIINSSIDVFIDELYTGDMSGTVVTLAKVSANQLAFIIPPETITGDKELKFTITTEDITLPIKISTPTVILTVPDVIATIDNSLDNIKTQEINADTLIKSGKYDKADIDYLKNLNDTLQAYKTKFSNASPEVQKYTLLFLAANKPILNDLSNIAYDYDGMGLNKKGFSDFLRDFGGKVIFPTILAGVAIAFIPPAVVGSLGVASAIGIGTMIGWNLQKSQVTGALSKIKELITVADNKTEIPSELSFSKTEFEANVKTPVNSDITYRTISETDENSTSPVLSGYVKNFKTLRNEWRKNIKNSLGDLKDFVTKKITSKPKPEAQLKVEVIDQPDVTVEVKGTPDNFELDFKTLNKQLKELNIRITYLEKDWEEVKKVLGIKIVTTPEVKIGTQIWMLKNLDVSTYRNGDIIPQVTDATQWAALTTGAWCYYENNSANGTIYGKLYNWYAINDSRGLAPTGYHIPSDAEWTTLTTYLGGYSIAGGKLKETGIAHWNSPNTGATNSSGFTALPGGIRINTTGIFSEIGNYGYWYSSTEETAAFAWGRNINCYNSHAERSYGYKKDGISVRCIRD